MIKLNGDRGSIFCTLDGQIGKSAIGALEAEPIGQGWQSPVFVANGQAFLCLQIDISSISYRILVGNECKYRYVIFIARRSYASAVLGVRPSVCPSVTRVLCD